jgi:hypothetical protein
MMILAFALAVVAFPQLAVAQPREPDSVFVTGQADSSASFSGGRGEAEWLHFVSSRTAVILGGGTTSLAHTRWAYGSMGGVTRRGDLLYIGRISMGSGRSLQGGFTYLRVIGTVSFPVSSHSRVDAEAQYARAEGVKTAATTVSAAYSGIPRTTLRAGYSSAVSATLTHYLTTRADVTVGRVTVLTGATTSLGADAPLTWSPINLSIGPSTEWFMGGSVGIGRVRTIATVEFVPHAAGRLIRTTATIQLRLKPPPRADGSGSQQ